MHPLSGSPSSIRKEYLNNPLSEPSLEQRLQFPFKQSKRRRQAQKDTEFCNKRMIRLKSKQNPPSVYHVDEAVLVRVKDQGSRRYWVLNGKIVQRNVKLSKYKVVFQIPGDPEKKEKWFFVSDVTSTTRLKERLRSKSTKTSHPLLIEYTHRDRLDDFISMHLNVRFDPAPDGNCQFAAIADQLATCGIFRSAATLREEIVQDLRSNPYAHAHTFITLC